MTTQTRTPSEQHFANGVAGLEQAARSLETVAASIRARAADLTAVAAEHGEEFITGPYPATNALQSAQSATRDIARAQEYLLEAIGEISKAQEARA